MGASDGQLNVTEYSACVLVEEYFHMMGYTSHFGELIRVMLDSLSDFIYTF